VGKIGEEDDRYIYGFMESASPKNRSEGSPHISFYLYKYILTSGYGGFDGSISVSRGAQGAAAGLEYDEYDGNGAGA